MKKRKEPVITEEELEAQLALLLPMEDLGTVWITSGNRTLSGLFLSRT